MNKQAPKGAASHVVPAKKVVVAPKTGLTVGDLMMKDNKSNAQATAKAIVSVLGGKQ